MDLLAQGERSVEDLAKLSQHLKASRAALIVSVRREGAYAFYRLSSDAVLRVRQAIRGLGQSQFAEIDRLLDMFARERDCRSPLQAP